MSVEPWSADSFEARYQADHDPWDFVTSPYEQGRYDAVMGALSRRSYAAVYEPGCSVGALTTRLAERCDRLIATDVSPTAVARARARCADLDHVRVEVGSVADPPAGPFELVVFSELGYYFDIERLDGIIIDLAARVAPGGELLACHWLGESSDHRLHGSVVHERLQQLLTARFEHLRHLTDPGFVLDTWCRA